MSAGLLVCSSFDLSVNFLETTYSFLLMEDPWSVTFTSIKKWLLSTILFKENLGGVGGEDLFSNQQMGLEVQKNICLLMLSEVEGCS